MACRGTRLGPCPGLSPPVSPGTPRPKPRSAAPQETRQAVTRVTTLKDWEVITWEDRELLQRLAAEGVTKAPVAVRLGSTDDGKGGSYLGDAAEV